ncbi:methyl-CpG-binding domain-containing protein 2-like [Andrographis paniculata]|uniref:methyl-CpG-binding domain-containing protein 2-like n=1 Tax=Andrographis paniculata TaxID=175694 RepID=UPI0021E7E516|nr:methyl-CpG-binding domain-containing protein 2-like [Andrographis paniculata]
MDPHASQTQPSARKTMTTIVALLVWAIEKPNFPQTPPGWQRLVKIRARGGTKFVDIYYVSPSDKRLRSIVEVEGYLFPNPDNLATGIERNRFSFKIPRPLLPYYVRICPCPTRLISADDATTSDNESLETID